MASDLLHVCSTQVRVVSRGGASLDACYAAGPTQSLLSICIRVPLSACVGCLISQALVHIGRTPRGSCNRTRLLDGFLEGSLKEVLLRRVLRRRLVRVSIETEVLRRVLRRGGVIEGA